MAEILVLNGPNLNLLGTREPELYGAETLDDVARMCRDACAPGFEIDTRQSNHEGTLVDWIQAARGTTVGIVLNPGAYGHTSIALLDALNAYEGPAIEVHVSQIHKREPFRHQTYTSRRADAVIAGLGVEGYAAAVRRICQVAG